MRIDLGSTGKIIGTRRVSPNGQVSGLRDFAGEEVLVVLPGTGESAEAPEGEYLKNIQELVQAQVEKALQQYMELQKVYTAPFDIAQGMLGQRRGAKAGKEK